MIAVFLVDDHEIVRRGVRSTLEADPELTVVGEAGTAAQANACVPALRPDVAVLDVRLPDGNGVELCRDLRSAMPDLRCLMLTSFSDDEAILDAVVAGAAGYLIKDLKSARLVEAIKSIAAGRPLLDHRATEAVMRKLRGDAQAESGPLSELTDRERELLELIGKGLTNRQIGAQMFLAEKTVKNYVSRLLAKLGMHRRTQAAAFAVRQRLDRA